MGGEFKWRHFAGELILLCVRWYCKYGISYRNLEEMMGERGVAVDHTTLYRWVQRYAPELEKRMLWYQNRLSFSWRVDETYIRVKGRWKLRLDTASATPLPRPGGVVAMGRRYGHLSHEERGMIFAERRRGASLRAIGGLLGPGCEHDGLGTGAWRG